jgi:hypothetical protein
VLDADQVRRIVAGQPVEEPKTPAAAAPPPEDQRRAKERPSIVPPIPPLNKPLTQE